MKRRLAQLRSQLTTYRRQLGVVLIVASIAFLVWYCVTHPAVLQTLAQTDPHALLIIFALYSVGMGIIFLVNFFTVRICRKQLDVKQGIFLTIYSTVINFFGPLQSGPGVRAVYLKTKIGLRIRDYTLATLFYYLAFGAINASLLFIGSWWPLTILGLLSSIVLTIIAARSLKLVDRLRDIGAIYLVALLQTAVMIAIYYTELHATHTLASLLQTAIYTASANLSLFVSLTPGGIGIRESFIVFASSLHHLPLAAIIAAGVLDRALYVVFLAILFVVSSSLHLKDMIRKKTA